jgi:hypothetical protein
MFPVGPSTPTHGIASWVDPLTCPVGRWLLLFPTTGGGHCAVGGQGSGCCLPGGAPDSGDSVLPEGKWLYHQVTGEKQKEVGY